MGEVCLGFSVVRAQGLRMGLEFRGLVQARLQGSARVYGAVYRLSGLEVVGEPPEEKLAFDWLSLRLYCNTPKNQVICKP